MEFDKSKVFTALNADELKVGSKVIVADNLLELKEDVLKHRLPKVIKNIESARASARFLCNDDFHYSLAYLVEEPEEKGLKVADLKIGDVIKPKINNNMYSISGINYVDKSIFFGGDWADEYELKHWEKVE